MAKAWIELSDEQAGFGPSRTLIGQLNTNGYSAALWRLVVGKALILTGSKLTDDELRAIGGPPESWT